MLKGVLLECEVLIGAQVVDPELARPRRLALGLALEEEQIVGLDALSVEDTGGEPEQGVDVVLAQEPAPHGLPGSALEEHVVSGTTTAAEPPIFKRVCRRALPQRSGLLCVRHIRRIYATLESEPPRTRT